MGKLVNKNKKPKSVPSYMPIFLIPPEGMTEEQRVVVASNPSAGERLKPYLFCVSGEKMYLGCTKVVEDTLGLDAARWYLLKYVDSDLYRQHRSIVQSDVVNITPLENGMKIIVAPQGKEYIVALCDEAYQVKWNLSSA